MDSPRNIALVHDWLVSMRGGEKVLEILCELFPQATLFTLVHQKGSASTTIEWMKITTSVLQKFPFGQSHYQYFLPLFPTIVKGFDLRDFDLVISSSHAAAKGVKVAEKSLHICYCHTPMRYIWDQYDNYFGADRSSIFTRTAIRLSVGYLRQWDVENSRKVHHFIANSVNVQKRIKVFYQRESDIIYPPVDIHRFFPSEEHNDYYLIVSALVPYKRIDIAIDTFNRLDERLIIIGDGIEENRLKARAKKNIEFVGWVSDRELEQYYAGCKAVIFPGEEDFGIVPVEAMASGKPVIAIAKGGALETVVDGKTGVLFHEQNVESLMKAVQSFSDLTFDPIEIRNHTFQFDRSKFKGTIEKYIQSKWSEYLRDVDEKPHSLSQPH